MLTQASYCPSSLPQWDRLDVPNSRLPQCYELFEGGKPCDSSFLHKWASLGQPEVRKWDVEVERRGICGLRDSSSFTPDGSCTGRQGRCSFIPFPFFHRMSHPEVTWHHSSLYIALCQAKSACNYTHPQRCSGTAGYQVHKHLHIASIFSKVSSRGHTLTFVGLDCSWQSFSLHCNMRHIKSEDSRSL